MKRMNSKMCVSGVLAVLWLVLIFLFSGIYFETNDDRYITEILSGALTGKCEPHVIFINYLLSLPLSLLYSLTTSIPWYGLMLVGFHWLAYSVIIYSLLKLCNTWKSTCVHTFLLFVIFFSGVYLTGLIQFTSTAALLAIAGYMYLFFLFLTEKHISKQQYIVFFLLELGAFFVRENSMIMISVLGIGTFLGLCLCNRDYQKSAFCALTSVLICVILVFAIGKMGTAIGYQGSEWDSYNRFNVARADLFDYQGAPAYEDVESILNKYGVSEKEYKAFCYYTILETNISAECIEEIRNYVYDDNELTAYDTSMSFFDTFLATFRNYFSSDLWGIGKLIVVSYSIALASIILYRKYFLLIPLMGILASRTIAWWYLLYKGRIINRVSVPLYLCELLFIFFVFIIAVTTVSENALYEKKENMGTSDEKKYFVYVRCCFLLVLGILLVKTGYHTGLQEIKYIKEQNSTQKIYMQGLVELQDYINSCKSQVFLIEADALSYYRGSVFETRVYKAKNGIVTGSWYSQSPPMKICIREYLKDKDKIVSLVVAEGSEERNVTVLNYLEDYFGCSPIFSDSFVASHGGKYFVYSFE